MPYFKHHLIRTTRRVSANLNSLFPLLTKLGCPIRRTTGIYDQAISSDRVSLFRSPACRGELPLSATDQATNDAYGRHPAFAARAARAEWQVLPWDVDRLSCLALPCFWLNSATVVLSHSLSTAGWCSRQCKWKLQPGCEIHRQGSKSSGTSIGCWA